MDIKEMIYVGIVTSYGERPATVRVSHRGRVSAELAVMQPVCMKNKEYRMPAIDEQVLVIQLPNAGGKGINEGFVIGSFYNEEDIPEENEPKVQSMKNEDGSYIRFDGKGNLELHATGDIKMTVGGQVKVDKG